MTYVHFKIKTNQYDVKIRNSYQSLMYFAKNLTLFEQGEFFRYLFVLYSEDKCNKNTFTVATLTCNYC